MHLANIQEGGLETVDGIAKLSKSLTATSKLWDITYSSKGEDDVSDRNSLAPT